GKERIAGKKGAARGDLDLLMARLPVQAARIAQAPIMDVMLFGKYAKAITALNRAQEMTLRKALFDGSIRAELVKRGFGKELQKSPDRWDIPKDKLAEAAE
ncbi:MAG: hypothetical protein GWO24_17905, partial [Akkermansiaceae bacterium]|nr:hypothetical protein [Akkermansiaceae bacterium]NIS14048.1 hypothetical protein [Thermoplasmata archaeon]